MVIERLTGDKFVDLTADRRRRDALRLDCVETFSVVRFGPPSSRRLLGRRHRILGTNLARPIPKSIPASKLFRFALISAETASSLTCLLSAYSFCAAATI